ncbi:hypothetical protein BLNAU_4234 [Blattamonas nauphoetae]|uniref:Transmembrane protein n=1 Tax=Blattamonas nauphoetae TaxID=2049346 RepID=A0ABQ9YAN7_9EUKA|nr:hypothetical protein BLNAU_4234 [Blattamonas nauphoetae]
MFFNPSYINFPYPVLYKPFSGWTLVTMILDLLIVAGWAIQGTIMIVRFPVNYPNFKRLSIFVSLGHAFLSFLFALIPWGRSPAITVVFGMEILQILRYLSQTIMILWLINHAIIKSIQKQSSRQIARIVFITIYLIVFIFALVMSIVWSTLVNDTSPQVATRIILQTINLLLILSITIFDVIIIVRLFKIHKGLSIDKDKNAAKRYLVFLCILAVINSFETVIKILSVATVKVFDAPMVTNFDDCGLHLSNCNSFLALQFVANLVFHIIPTFCMMAIMIFPTESTNILFSFLSSNLVETNASKSPTPTPQPPQQTAARIEEYDETMDEYSHQAPPSYSDAQVKVEKERL